MKKYVLTLYFVCLAPIVLGDFPVRVRLCQSFDSGWKFFKGDAIGAHETIFNDNQWKMVNVPHDWSIEGPFLRDAPSGGDGAFLPTGISWYRKPLRCQRIGMGNAC
ncbi:MAG: hypothetical protein GX455_16800 [Phycisphaerae bacterium]|nr:hypothetical protein [Phycisphaerae bacterium]